VLVTLALTGCGTAQTTTAPTGSTLAEAVTVGFRSPALRGTRLPALYTCDGENVSPPLSWGAVPSDISELALFALGPAPSGSGARQVEWAVAGVRPTLRHLRAGELPRGAFFETGSNGKRGYSLCPAKSHTVHYEFALYALPPGARATPALGGPELLHNLTESSPQYAAPAHGAFSVVYSRR
jgi:phosphatidylethanolamine-binding protein (PEBP) family uncharacterized protein